MVSADNMDRLNENIDSFNVWDTIEWHYLYLEDLRRHRSINRVAYFEVNPFIPYAAFYFIFNVNYDIYLFWLFLKNVIV